VHEYFRISLPQTWAVVSQDLEHLQQAIEQMMGVLDVRASRKLSE